MSAEGMPGFMKALKLVACLQELELTEEEIQEAVEHFNMTETTHGLIWGNIANLERERKGIALLGLLKQILVDVTAWRKKEEYIAAVVAAGLRQIRVTIEILEEF